MRLIFTFPQVTFEEKEIEVSEEQAEEIMNGCLEERAKFILQHITESEKDWIPRVKGSVVEGIVAPMDAGYCGIKIG